MPLWADRYRCDLAWVDVETGEVLRLAEDWSLTVWRVAPDGHSVAAFRYTAVDQTRQQVYWDLTVLPIDGGESRVVARKLAGRLERAKLPRLV